MQDCWLCACFSHVPLSQKTPAHCVGLTSLIQEMLPFLTANNDIQPVEFTLVRTLASWTGSGLEMPYPRRLSVRFQQPS